MPSWKYTIRLADVFHSDAPFEQRRDAIVARVRASQWFTDTPAPSPLHACLNYLAEASDIEDFDRWWAQLYYLADDDRAWLATR